METQNCGYPLPLGQAIAYKVLTANSGLLSTLGSSVRANQCAYICLSVVVQYVWNNFEKNYLLRMMITLWCSYIYRT